MTRHIFVNQESTNDNISIFYDEPSFIVVANRTDLPKINLIEESRKPGIYILMNESKRYVGQASGSIFSRIQQHDLNKKWWNKVIFFGREDGHLNKAQLDFIEAKLINNFIQSEFELDNNTNGNSSYIDKLSKISATSLLSRIDETLREVANISLFDKTLDDVVEKRASGYEHHVVFMGKKFVNKSARKILLEVIKDIITSGYVNKLAPILSDSEPSTTKFLGTKTRISANGTRLTNPIAGTPYYLYVTFSTESIQNKLEIISQLTNQKIDINFKSDNIG